MSPLFIIFRGQIALKYAISLLSSHCFPSLMVRPTESTKGILDNYRMPSAEDSWSTEIEQLTLDLENLVLCDTQSPPHNTQSPPHDTKSPPSSDARKAFDDDLPEDYHPETELINDAKIFSNDWCSDGYRWGMEPINWQEILGVETFTRARIPEGIGVVKERRCMIKELPPEIIGQILAELEQGSIANFRLASRHCAYYGLEYLFTKGKAQLNFCRELDYGMNTIANKNVSWRIKKLEIYGDMEEQLYGECRNLGHIHLHDRLMFSESLHRLNNLQSLKLQLKRQPTIPLRIHSAASFLMSRFLLHILIIHRSPIVKLSMLNVGWWVPYEKATKLAKAISNIEKFTLLGDLDSGDRYDDIFSYLQSMGGLKKLVIDFGMTSVNAPWDMSCLCGMKFDHLRLVCFSNVCASKEKLLQFFQSHPKLEDVRIGTMLLLDGSWLRTVHAMAKILRDLRNIKFSGLQCFTGGEEVYGGYICSNSLNAYIKHFAWKVVRLDSQARERWVTGDMLSQVRIKKAADGGLGAGDICSTCGYLMEFCMRLT